MEKHKFYYTYETTNLTNGKKYIGQHCTYDLNDGYYGSSRVLKQDIKSGHKIKVKILAYYDNIFDLGNAEYNLLKERNVVKNDLYYNNNISTYYNYSFEYGRSEETKAKIKKNAARVGPKKGTEPWNKGKNKENDVIIKQISESLKGHIISDETKAKISKSLRGRKTSSKTTKGMKFKFMNNGIKNSMIKDNLVNEYITKGWILGKIKKLH